MAKKDTSSFSNDEIREIILQYFYNRNANARSRKGKKGSCIKMRDIKAELKQKHYFKDNQIVSNLNYLISQGWIDEEIEKKSFTNDNGFSFPSETRCYYITASGIDKIEGPSRFTPKRFEGINVEAVGSVVTIGDGNQINVKFKEVGEVLSELRSAVSKSKEINNEVKLEIVTDIDSIQDQLAKPNPNKTVIQTLWQNIEKIAAVGSIVEILQKVSPFILTILS